MRIQTGKNAGKLSEVVFLKTPDLAQWMMKKAPENGLTTDFKRLKRIFDKKPITEEVCYGCNDTAVRASAYEKTSSLYFWCGDCEPYDSGARSGTLSIVTSFDSLMNHADFACQGNRTIKRNLVKHFSEAKGLPKRVTEKVAQEFFGGA